MAFKKDNYPENWKDEIRPAVLKRDGYKCGICKVRQRAKGYRDVKGVFVDCDEFMLAWAKKQGLKVFTIFLSVMHLDHNTQNNDLQNLLSGCQQCHNRHDKNHRAMNRIKKSPPAILPAFFAYFIVCISLFSCLLGSFNSFGQSVDWSKISHFHRAEFDCKCEVGSGDLMQHDFVRRLDMARELSGVKFLISSGYRTKDYNKQVGGSSSSAHIAGLAADIVCANDQDRWKIIKALQQVGFQRFGIYSTHIHVDHDTTKKPSIMWLECR